MRRADLQLLGAPKDWRRERGASLRYMPRLPSDGNEYCQRNSITRFLIQYLDLSFEDDASIRGNRFRFRIDYRVLGSADCGSKLPSSFQ